LFGATPGEGSVAATGGRRPVGLRCIRFRWIASLALLTALLAGCGGKSARVGQSLTETIGTSRLTGTIDTAGALDVTRRVNAAQFRSVKVGASMPSITRRFGDPDSTITSAGRSCLQYTGAAGAAASYEFCFAHGRLVSKQQL
jgi:hypothetical protein